MPTHPPTQAQRTLAAVQSAQRCALCLERECECWTDIARIVNAHDALVAALVEGKEAAGLLMSEHECHKADCQDAQRYKRICAALKLAESPPTP